MVRMKTTPAPLGRTAWTVALVLGVATALAAVTARAEAKTAPLLDPDTAGPSAGPGAPLEAAAPIDLNAATEEQLMLLPGIGPAKAKAIVSYRAKRAFRTVDDLLRVKGIGRVLLKRIRPFVVVDAYKPSLPSKGAPGVRSK